MIHEYEAIDGMKLCEGNELLGENLPQYHFSTTNTT
jgi:hypothetical protein